MIFKPDIPDANVVKAGSAVYEDRVLRPGFKSFEVQQREMNVLRLFKMLFFHLVILRITQLLNS